MPISGYAFVYPTEGGSRDRTTGLYLECIPGSKSASPLRVMFDVLVVARTETKDNNPKLSRCLSLSFIRPGFLSFLTTVQSVTENFHVEMQSNDFRCPPTKMSTL